MRLFKYEMKKLLLNRKTLIILLVLFIFYAAVGFGSSLVPFGSVANYKTFDSLADGVTGGYNADQAAISTAEAQKIQERYGSAEAVGDAGRADPMIKFNQAYSAYAIAVKDYNDGAKTDSTALPYGIKPVKAVLTKMELNGETKTYAYQKLSTQLETSLKLGEPTFSNTSLWNTLYGSWGGYLILILLFFPIAYFSAPIYTKEVTTGMDNIILSSKNGQNKIVMAKLATVSVTSAVVALVYLAATFIGNFLPFMTFEGIGATVRSMNIMVRAPFGFTISQFVLITVLWVILISIVFGFIMMLLSAKMKNQSAVFGIGITLLLGNILLEALGTNFSAFILTIIKFGFVNIGNVTTIFGGVTTFNIFGMVVPYWLATLGVVSIVSIVVIAFIFRAQKIRAIVK